MTTHAAACIGLGILASLFAVAAALVIGDRRATRWANDTDEDVVA